MIQELVKLADTLDSKGLTAEADILDGIIIKEAVQLVDKSYDLERTRGLINTFLRKIQKSGVPEKEVGAFIEKTKDKKLGDILKVIQEPVSSMAEELFLDFLSWISAIKED